MELLKSVFDIPLVMYDVDPLFNYSVLPKIVAASEKSSEYPVFISFHKGSENVANTISNAIDRVFGVDTTYIYTKQYANFSDDIKNNISGRIFDCRIFITIISMDTHDVDSLYLFECEKILFTNSKFDNKKKIIPVFKGLDCGEIPPIYSEARKYFEYFKYMNGVSTENENYLYDLMDIIESYGLKRQKESVKFSLSKAEAEYADAVYLVGCFNDWGKTGNLMTETNSGFETTIMLEKGRKYYFKYIFKVSKWITPPNCQTCDDDHGGGNAIADLTDSYGKVSVSFFLSKDDAENAEEVYLVGCFNDWGKPGSLMKKTYSGFEITITLEAGRKYYFKYILKVSKWITPPNYKTEGDDYNGIIEL